MTEEITTLDGLDHGRFIVTTENGTKHYVDLDLQTSTRVGAPGREWGDRLFVPTEGVLSGTNPKLTVREEHITPDGTPFRYLTIRDATVGKTMKLENRDEWRITSHIQYIERLGEG